MNNDEEVQTAIQASYRRETQAMVNKAEAMAFDQLTWAFKTLHKHLGSTPAGTAIRDLIAAK